LENNEQLPAAIKFQKSEQLKQAADELSVYILMTL